MTSNTARECCIPMCGVDDTNAPLIPCCENGHWLHIDCLQYLRDQLACPLCRSKVLKTMRQSSGLPMECLIQTPLSQYGAVVAISIGKADYARERRREMIPGGNGGQCIQS